MLNPYTLLTPGILNAMLKQPMYFVRQSYKRGSDHFADKEDISLLFTHYPHHEIEKERAERHMRLLKKDPYRFLYDSTKEDQLQKLLKAAAQPEGYRIYINLLPKKWKAGDGLKRENKQLHAS